MKQNEILDRWLGSDEKTKKWAARYLIRRGLAGRQTIFSSEEAIIISALGDVGSVRRELTDTKMRAALSQKKHRDSKNGKKSYTFEMSTKVGHQLHRLKLDSGLTINEIVEHIVMNTYQQEKTRWIEEARVKREKLQAARRTISSSEADPPLGKR